MEFRWSEKGGGGVNRKHMGMNNNELILRRYALETVFISPNRCIYLGSRSAAMSIRREANASEHLSSVHAVTSRAARKSP